MRRRPRSASQREGLTPRVDGDPLKNLALLTDPAKGQLVMNDGVIHKDCSTPVPHEAALHLPGADRPLQEEGVKEALAASRQ